MFTITFPLKKVALELLSGGSAMSPDIVQYFETLNEANEYSNCYLIFQTVNKYKKHNFFSVCKGPK